VTITWHALLWPIDGGWIASKESLTKMLKSLAVVLTDKGILEVLMDRINAS
jgi:hypothetical protein